MHAVCMVCVPASRVVACKARLLRASRISHPEQILATLIFARVRCHTAGGRQAVLLPCCGLPCLCFFPLTIRRKAKPIHGLRLGVSVAFFFFGSASQAPDSLKSGWVQSRNCAEPTSRRGERAQNERPWMRQHGGLETFENSAKNETESYM